MTFSLSGKAKDVDYALMVLANWFGVNTPISQIDRDELFYVADKYCGARLNKTNRGGDEA